MLLLLYCILNDPSCNGIVLKVQIMVDDVTCRHISFLLIISGPGKLVPSPQC